MISNEAVSGEMIPMEEEIDFRAALSEARRAAEALGRNGSRESLEAWWEVCCGDVLLAERNISEQDRIWENASLARELLHAGTFLEGYDTMLDNLRSALDRMAGLMSDHPRLKLELLELELTVLRRLEALSDGESGLSDEVQEQIDFYRRNLARAERGEWEQIEPRGCLKQDPVEWSAEYERVIDAADEKVGRSLAGIPRGMGFCHAFWNERARVLREEYGLEWRSPAVMNPGVMFD